jgi:hypothetical protein
MPNEKIKKAIKLLEDRSLIFWGVNNMYRYQQKEQMSRGQIKMLDELKKTVDMARQDLYEVIESLETSGV